MSHGRPWWIAAVLIVFLVIGCSPFRKTPASVSETAELQQKITDLQQKVFEKQAEAEVLEAERKLLEAEAPAENPGGKARNLPSVKARDLLSASSVLRSMDDRLQASAEKRREALEKLATDAAKDRDQAVGQWRKARQAAVDAQAQLAEVKAQLVAQGNAGGWEDVWDFWLVVIVIGGCLLLAFGFGLGTHVERVRLRRRLRSGLVSMALVSLALAGHAAPARAAAREELEQEHQRLLAKLGELEARLEENRKLIEKQREQSLAYWQELLAVPGARDVPEAGQNLSREEKKAHSLLRKALIDSRIAERASAAGLALAAKTGTAQMEVPKLATRSHKLNVLRVSAKAGACVGFACLAFVPLYLARRRAKKRLDREVAKCPCCGIEGQLARKKASPKDIECNKCGHEFPVSYQRLPRLCFPTVGVRESGKTHWLATAYDRIKNNNVPLAGPSLQNQSSQADAIFDAHIQMVLDNRTPPGATIAKLQAPLTFHVRDDDEYGPSCALLNMFDFSGEVMNSRIDMEELRQRAFEMDGLVLFLDPTQVVRSAKSAGLDVMNRQVSKFRDDMRKALDLDPGALLRVPVAVCVSKLDLLVSDNPFGGAAKPWLSKLRATARWPLTLESVEKRSAMLAAVLRNIFPGWDISKALTESFGNHFRFFPMTPVGMEEHELGIKDLSRRTIRPFGIIEPILWLLHMRGYVVLK